MGCAPHRGPDGSSSSPASGAKDHPPPRPASLSPQASTAGTLFFPGPHGGGLSHCLPLNTRRGLLVGRRAPCSPKGCPEQSHLGWPSCVHQSAVRAGLEAPRSPWNSGPAGAVPDGPPARTPSRRHRCPKEDVGPASSHAHGSSRADAPLETP